MLGLIQDRKRLVVVMAVLVAIVALVPAALAAPDSGPIGSDGRRIGLLVAVPVGRGR